MTFCPLCFFGRGSFGIAHVIFRERNVFCLENRMQFSHKVFVFFFVSESIALGDKNFYEFHEYSC